MNTQFLFLKAEGLVWELIGQLTHIFSVFEYSVNILYRDKLVCFAIYPGFLLSHEIYNWGKDMATCVQHNKISLALVLIDTKSYSDQD